MESLNEKQTNVPFKPERSLYPANSIRCKHCNRLFASISIEDGLVPYTPPSQACASCEPFLSLYEALQTAEQAHTALLDRGPKHHGRTSAHYKLRNARVALENFLLNVEAPNEASFDVAQAGFANRADTTHVERANDLVEALQPEQHQQFANGGSPRVKHLPSVNVSPSSKRKPICNSRGSNLERKRIKFTESVEERPEYRCMDEFLRSGKTYVPGRYVAAEGFEYLDTSGSSLTFAKFTGQKKVGSTFVDIIPKEEAYEDKAGIPAAKSKRKCNVQNKQSDGRGVDAGLESLESKEFELTLGRDRGQMTRRMLRNTRQPRSTMPPATTKLRKAVAQCDGKNDEPQDTSYMKPSLVVVLKVPYPAKGVVSTDVRASTDASRHEGVGRPSGEAELDEARREAAEVIRIKNFVTNIQRELENLQQATFTLRYAHTVSSVVRDFFQALEPLKHIPIPELLESEEPEETTEEGSIYFEALDAADKGVDQVTSIDTPRQFGDYRQRENDFTWVGTSVQNERMNDANASHISDAKTLDCLPMGIDQNASDASILGEQDTIGNNFKDRQCHLTK